MAPAGWGGRDGGYSPDYRQTSLAPHFLPFSSAYENEMPRPYPKSTQIRTSIVGLGGYFHYKNFLLAEKQFKQHLKV